jgi:hypothetical protein
MLLYDINIFDLSEHQLRYSVVKRSFNPFKFMDGSYLVGNNFVNIGLLD